jgi:hypothetical protein
VRIDNKRCAMPGPDFGWAGLRDVGQGWFVTVRVVVACTRMACLVISLLRWFASGASQPLTDSLACGVRVGNGQVPITSCDRAIVRANAENRENIMRFMLWDTKFRKK